MRRDGHAEPRYSASRDLLQSSLILSSSSDNGISQLMQPGKSMRSENGVRQRQKLRVARGLARFLIQSASPTQGPSPLRGAHGYQLQGLVLQPQNPIRGHVPAGTRGPHGIRSQLAFSYCLELDYGAK